MPSLALQTASPSTDTFQEEDAMTGQEEANTRVDDDVQAASGRQVAKDVAEWWIHVLLRDANVSRFSVLETVLPHLSPLQTQSDLATRFRVLSLWQEVLTNTHIEGDFLLLQDKLLLLSTLFARSPLYEECIELLRVHEQLCALHQRLLNLASSHDTEDITKDAIEQGCDTYRQALRSIFLGTTVPQKLLNMVDSGFSSVQSMQQRIQDFVAGNVNLESGDSDHDYAYAYVRCQMQALLISWMEENLETPMLVQLGYRLPQPPSTEADVDSQTATWDTQAAALETAPPVPTVTQVRNSEERVSPRTLEVTANKRSIEDLAACSQASDSPKSDRAATQPPTQTEQSPNEQSFGEERKPQRSRQARKRRPISLLQKSQPPGKRRRVNLNRRSRDDEWRSADEADSEDEIGEPVNQQRRWVDSPGTMLSLSPSSRSEKGTTQHRRARSLTRDGRRRGHQTIKTRHASLSPPGERQPRILYRRSFSKEEEKAIIGGVVRHGRNWARVRSQAEGLLDDRTTMQIADKARTLMRQGKLKKSFLDDRRGLEETTEDDW